MADELDLTTPLFRQRSRKPQLDNADNELEEILRRKRRAEESALRAKKEAIERDEQELIKPAFSAADKAFNDALENAENENEKQMRILRDERPPPGLFETEFPGLERPLNCPVKLSKSRIESLTSDSMKHAALEGKLSESDLNLLVQELFLNESETISEQCASVLMLALTQRIEAMYDSSIVSLSDVLSHRKSTSWCFPSAFFKYLVLRSLESNSLNIRRLCSVLWYCPVDEYDNFIYWLTLLLCCPCSQGSERPLGQLIVHYVSKLDSEQLKALARRILSICLGKIDGLNGPWKDKEVDMHVHRIRRVAYSMLPANGLLDAFLSEVIVEQCVLGESQAANETRPESVDENEWENCDVRVRSIVSFLLNNIKHQQQSHRDISPITFNKWESIAKLLEVLASINTDRATHSVISKGSVKVLAITSKTQLKAHHSFVEYMRFLKRRYEFRELKKDSLAQHTMDRFFGNNKN